MFKKDQIVIYRDNRGDIKVDVKLHDETVWLTQPQIANLFNKERSVITRHINNIFKEGELENSVCVKFARTGSDGKAYQTQYYNLDMVISVGYRVNSKKAVEFRRWANSVLKEYLLKGYSVNHQKIMTKQLTELKETILLLSDTLVNQNLVSDRGSELLMLIKSYAKTWDILAKYDEGRLELPQARASEELKILDYAAAKQAIVELKKELMVSEEAGALFAQERECLLEGIIGNLYQTFDGRELYQSLYEKAANLLYFIIKDHPFSDGNKRIGCLLFLLFLSINGLKTRSLGPEGLTALALLIAESDPAQKGIMIRLVVSLLNEEGGEIGTRPQ